METKPRTAQVWRGGLDELPALGVDHVGYERAALDVQVLVPRPGQRKDRQGEQDASYQADSAGKDVTSGP